jgi:DNA-binding CsgD family transcriptional regulator
MSSSNIYAGELLEGIFSPEEIRILELVLSDKTSEEIFAILMEEEE